MAKGGTLKEQNAPLVRAAVVGHVVAFAWAAGEPLRLLRMDGTALSAKLGALAAPGASAVGLIVLASLLLLGALNPDWRDRLMHWRWRDVLPGCRAFTRVGPASGHVDMDALRARRGPLPVDGAAQNRLFYRIYREHRDEVGVLDAHRRYLAARDVGTITALLAPVLPWLAWWGSGDGRRALGYAAALFGVYALCVAASRNYGWRMVQHVLALDSAAPRPRAHRKASGSETKA